MRKTEWVPWVLIIIVVSFLSLCFLSVTNFDAYTPITVEITGAFLGFLLAISFAEIIKLSEKRVREKDLLQSLISEMIPVVLHSDELKEGPNRISDDMWQMGLSSGDLTLFDSYKRNRFFGYYIAVRNYNEIHKTWLAAVSEIRMENANMLQEELAKIMDIMTKTAKEIISDYAPKMAAERIK